MAAERPRELGGKEQHKADLREVSHLLLHTRDLPNIEPNLRSWPVD